MRLTDPLFLFIFLPLSLPLLPLCPPRYRKAVLSLISIAFFVLFNLSAPLSLLQIAAVVLLLCLLSALPARFPAALRCALGVALPLAFLIASRLLAEYAPFPYTYPIGLTMVTLGAISMSVDRYRNDAPEQESPLDVVGYLLFFPVMGLGPVLRYKQYLYVTEHITPGAESFSRGVQLYMLGFVKRMTLAAVLLRALQDIFSYAQGSALPLSLLPLLLLMAYALFYSFVTGTTDMARGLLAMYGVHPPRGQAGLLATPTSNRIFYGMLLSLDRYLEDYVAAPLRRRFRGVFGKLFACVAVFLFTVLFYRTRPEMLLFALPLLVIALASVSLRRWSRVSRNLLLHALCMLLSLLPVALLALALTLKEPLQLFSLFSTTAPAYPTYYLFGAIPDARYLAMALCLLLLVPLSQLYRVLMHRRSERLRMVCNAVLTVLLFGAFVVTVVYFLPQFPQYADLAYSEFFV